MLSEIMFVIRRIKVSSNLQINARRPLVPKALNQSAIYMSLNMSTHYHSKLAILHIVDGVEKLEIVF